MDSHMCYICNGSFSETNGPVEATIRNKTQRICTSCSVDVNKMIKHILGAMYNGDGDISEKETNN